MTTDEAQTIASAAVRRLQRDAAAILNDTEAATLRNQAEAITVLQTTMKRAQRALRHIALRIDDYEADLRNDNDQLPIGDGP